MVAVPHLKANFYLALTLENSSLDAVITNSHQEEAPDLQDGDDLRSRWKLIIETSVWEPGHRYVLKISRNPQVLKVSTSPLHEVTWEDIDSRYLFKKGRGTRGRKLGS